MITRGLKSTPTAHLEIIAGLPPIPIKLQEISTKTANRLTLQGHWDSNYVININGRHNSHAYAIDRIIAKIPIFGCKIIDTIQDLTILDRRFKVSIVDRQQVISIISNFKDTDWSVYTDGSKSDKHLTGAGFCVYHNNIEIFSQSYSLGTTPSVYQSEVFALHMACSWANLNVSSPGIIHFLSDSQSAIQAINATRVRSRMIADIIEQLNSLGNKHKVDLSWVPGHEGITGNERADEKAREGSSQLPVGPEPFTPLDNTSINRELRNFLLRKHIKQYSNLNYSDKGKKPLLAYLNKYSYKLPHLSGIEIRQLTWTLSGHSPLAYFQYKCGNFSTPMCKQCNWEEETSEHFLCECPAFMTIRLQTFGYCITPLASLLTLDIGLINKYICRTGRYSASDLFDPY